MKKDIHPEYHEITVKMTNGETFTTRSTYGEAGETLQLDVDPHTHPAWTGGGAFVNKKAGKVADFNKRFGNLGSSASKKEAAQEEVLQNKEENSAEEIPETQDDVAEQNATEEEKSE